MIEHDCHYPLLLLSRLLNSRTEDKAIKKTIEDKDANFVFKFISCKKLELFRVPSALRRDHKE
jgi:hypothetical protein